MGTVSQVRCHGDVKRQIPRFRARAFACALSKHDTPGRRAVAMCSRHSTTSVSEDVTAHVAVTDSVALTGPVTVTEAGPAAATE